MQNDTPRSPDAESDRTTEDEPIPAASEDKVLEDTARLVREGRKALESDPKEQDSRPE